MLPALYRAMRWLTGGIAAVALLGCAEIVVDPSHDQREPVVESYDAMIDEDAGPEPSAPEPIPAWARDNAPPPAFPPPAVDEAR